ncbi:MAG: hypothetical protein E7016_03110 [Alphaproteobacteria bacterium]|nr:hypothetical protein [Alphaproteobacteria bacterium]
MNLLKLCWLKIKHHMPNIKKYILMLVKIYAIGMPILCIVFNMVVSPEFRTIEYKISSWLFRMSMFSFPILIGFLIYKILIPKSKIGILSEIIRLVVAFPLMFILLSLMLFCFVGSYADGSYDECMEWCVTKDLSNYNDCALSTCDFPI